MPIVDKLPPCPDPERYRLVRTREGAHWRLKKGLNKPTILNGKLPGLHFNKMITLLRKGFKEEGRLDASVLKELNLQKDYPLRKLIRGGFQWQHDREHHIFRFRIQIPERNGALLRKNKLMTAYRFIIILVQGNAEQERTMQLISTRSKDYTFAGTGVVGECLLELPYTPVPGQWLFCLRAEALEEGRVAAHPKSKGLLILDGGRWE